MKKQIPAANPEAYLRSLDGWRKDLVVHLRTEVIAAAKLDEQVKWGHLVFSKNGPVLLIRAEEKRVLFGFWHGQLLRDIEPRLKPGGKYEMATIEFREGDMITAAIVRKLARAAVKLNLELGNPADAVKKPAKKKH
ncbi:MAG: DUF1801 domain-containing protein [Nibricoccus sp.]